MLYNNPVNTANRGKAIMALFVAGFSTYWSYGVIKSGAPIIFPLVGVSLALVCYVDAAFTFYKIFKDVSDESDENTKDS